MRRPVVVWTSPLDCCDICGTRFGFPPVASPVMFDAALKSGPWANVCEPCFNLDGKGLGTGLGQRYELQVTGTPPQIAWIATGGIEGLDN